MDRIRYPVLGMIDEDVWACTSPVYFDPHRYRDLYWVSNPTSHHSHDLKRDDRLWVPRVGWEVHISGAHPTLGSGTDRRTPVDPTE